MPSSFKSLFNISFYNIPADSVYRLLCNIIHECSHTPLKYIYIF